MMTEAGTAKKPQVQLVSESHKKKRRKIFDYRKKIDRILISFSRGNIFVFVFGCLYRGAATYIIPFFPPV